MDIEATRSSYVTVSLALSRPSISKLCGLRFLAQTLLVGPYGRLSARHLVNSKAVSGFYTEYLFNNISNGRYWLAVTSVLQLTSSKTCLA